MRIVTDTNRLVRGHHHRVMQSPLLHIAAGADPHGGRALTVDLWAPYAAHLRAQVLDCRHGEMIAPAQLGRIVALIGCVLGEG